MKDDLVPIDKLAPSDAEEVEPTPALPLPYGFCECESIHPDVNVFAALYARDPMICRHCGGRRS